MPALPAMAPMIAPPAEPPTAPVRVRCCVEVMSAHPASPTRVAAMADLRILRMAFLPESAAGAGGRGRAGPGRCGEAHQPIDRFRVAVLRVRARPCDEAETHFIER